VELALYDDPENLLTVPGTLLEIHDLASATLDTMYVTSDQSEAIINSHVVIILTELVREPDEREYDFLRRNWELYKQYGTVSIGTLEQLSTEL